MSVLLSAVIYIFSFQLCEFAAITDDMKMDEVIMAAAPSHDMFDLLHVMDGKLMAMVELDLLLDMNELANYKLTSTRSRSKRKALRSGSSQLWEDKNVYYELTQRDFSLRDQGVIIQAINEWQNFTCLNFTQSSHAPSRILFRNGGGCYSRLGRSGGVQPIALAPGCRTKGIVVHEIGHAIGWFHEQTRPDRDDFITIDFSKIPANWVSQFTKVRDAFVDDRGVTYDYDSIMHYSGSVFGPRTIITRDPAAQNRLGQRSGLSFRDIKLANLMYGCHDPCTETTPCPGEGFRLENCKCVCPGPVGNPLVPCPNQQITTPPPTTPTTTTVSPVTTTPSGPDCMDLRLDCETLKDAGSCTSDRARMSVFCRKTCELCNAETECMDYDEACPFFASNGYCQRENIGPVFQQECPLSCEICTAVDTCLGRDPVSGSTKNGISMIVATLAMTVVLFFI